VKIVAFFELKEIRWDLPEDERRRIEARFPGVTIVAPEDRTELARELPDADVFVGWLFPRALFGSCPKLRWMHSAAAGIEDNLFPELVASDVRLTSSAGLHGVSIPEHVLAQMLVLARNFHEAARLQGRAEWNRFGLIAFGGGIRELDGSNLLILGAGAIGKNLARRAAALGMHVRVVRRNADRPVAGAEAVVPPERLHEALGWADFVVLAVPLTAETTNLIGERELAAMRSSAHLVNVARGEVVDEAALARALEAGAIAGAAIDVFATEPLPSGHAFWRLPNLVLTPHVSGYTPRLLEKILALFEENLDRFLAGRPLRNLVDKRLGYAPETDDE
jgi:phosphoglycerate dehydrogenase-like enzyme